MVAAKLSVMLIALVVAATASDEDNQCMPSSCGALRNISYPFRLKGDPPGCGDSNYELSCENNRSVLYLSSRRFFVVNISFSFGRTDNLIRLVDATLDNNTCSIPSSSFNLGYPYFGWDSTLFLITCPGPVNSSYYLDFSPCINSSLSPHASTYAVIGELKSFDVYDSCQIQLMFPFDTTVLQNLTNTSYSNRLLSISNLSISDIHNGLLLGFDVYVIHPPKQSKGGFNLFRRIWDFLYAVFNYYRFLVLVIIAGILVGRAVLGLPFVCALLIYMFRRRHQAMDASIEDFLQSCNNFMPCRYSYSEIKKMTNGFKNSLGHGGYGSVFRGKLRSGGLAAVKMLNDLKASGQDFISEVATIGKIHHTNVVHLVGFCVEGSKRALVYDFMPNGSLDKYIFPKGEDHVPLSWGKLYEIAVGVARGIEYLHEGCNMKILHFDIKPHNILLDENFVPKISDFGLAKLYPTDNSIVSLTAARGTLGYIAPELFYKNIGGVSHKADVYSFGMLLLEMVGRRKNFNAVADHSSQAYFPSWIYDRLEKGLDMDLEFATGYEAEVAKKMVMVALWCIQMKPTDRPSMRRVLELLEGDVGILTMPLKPFTFQEMITTGRGEDKQAVMAKSSCNAMDTVTLSGR